MNLTLHHFRKEARYLRPRWLAWLGLVLLQLAVDQEWIAPMQSGQSLPEWMDWLLMAIWGGALWLTASSTPENKPANERCFIATRPLPARCYWLARALVWLLMVVLPLVMTEGLHLLLSGRPFGDVLLGMAERAALACALTGWLLPMSVLWAGRQWFEATGFILGLFLLGERIATVVLPMFKIYWTPWDRTAFDSLVMAGLLFIVGLGFIAQWHRRKSASFKQRLAAFTGLAIACFALAAFWPLEPRSERGVDQARAEQIAQRASMALLHHSFHLYWKDEEESQHLFMPYQGHGLEPGISFHLRPQRAEVRHDGKALPCRVTRSYSARNRLQQDTEKLLVPYAVYKDLLPPGTLLRESRRNWWSDPSQTLFCELLKPFPNTEKPADFTTDFEVDWCQREMAGAALQAGAIINTSDIRVEVGRVRLNQDLHGAQQLGSISVDLRIQQRNLQDRPVRYLILLHSPQRHLAWLMAHDTGGYQTRAATTGQLRILQTLSWKDVLNYADGQDARVDPAQLQLKVLQAHHLGTTRWRWQSPALRLGDHMQDRVGTLWSDCALYWGRETKAFSERVATLVPPAANTPKDQVLRYVHDVSAAAHLINRQGRRNNELDQLIVKAMQPVIDHHLELLLALPDGAMPGNSSSPLRAAILAKISDAQKDFIIDHMLEQWWLTDIVQKRGWMEDAKRMKPQLLAKPTVGHSGVASFMLAFNDPELRARAVDHLRWWPLGSSVDKLIKYPDLRPQVESTVRDLFKAAHLNASIQGSSNVVTMAARLGDAEAFEIALRWAELSYETDVEPLVMVYLLGLRPKNIEEGMPIIKSLRGLTAKDFEYLPEQHIWKRKP